MGLDTRRLLLSERRLHIVHEPFCFFRVDDYLPQEVYRSLLETFPDQSCFVGDGYGKEGFRSSVDPEGFQKFCATRPVWGELTRFFRSDEFLDDLQRVLAGPLLATRGLLGRKPWRNYSEREVSHNPLHYLLSEPVRTTFQFSSLPRGAVVVPHADAPRKLVSLMIYLRDPAWRDEYDGGTEFYVPRDPKRAETWSETERIPFEDLELTGSTPFAENRLAGFVRSANSYHGVRPVDCPPGMARRSLLINVKRLKWSKRTSP